MSELIKCPKCPSDIVCEHDQEERRAICRMENIPEEPEAQVYDSTNVEQINHKRNKARRKISEAESDLRAVMKTPHGRRFIWGLLERCQTFRGWDFADARPIDPYRVMMADGARNIGIALMNDVHRLCMPDYLLMLKERSSEDAAA